jgi:23S rRNA (adenine2503-C2)-methyltransferase
MPQAVPFNVYDLDRMGWQNQVAAWGEPKFRAGQIWQGLYQQLWSSPEEFTNLPSSLRARLGQQFRFNSLKPSHVLHSSDRETVKTLFQLEDGRAIEAVLMKYEQRRTLCISTQAGCAMGCVFCATGQMGFKRNLTSGEIVEQVLIYARQLKQQDERVTNIVVMGMGEPFHNFDATLAAIDLLNDPQGFNMGERRFTISTVGLVPMIRKFAALKRQINLAISLHAANDELRTSLLPVNRKYPIAELLSACREYIDATNRRLTFEWALIQDVNDLPEHARELGGLLRGMLCHVNVIPLNPTRKYSGRATTHERAEAFKAELEKFGIPCTIRIRRGIDIQAGCGQLAVETRDKTVENRVLGA